MKNNDKLKENTYQFYLIYMIDFYSIADNLNLNIPKKKRVICGYILYPHVTRKNKKK